VYVVCECAYVYFMYVTHTHILINIHTHTHTGKRITRVANTVSPVGMPLSISLLSYDGNVEVRLSFVCVYGVCSECVRFWKCAYNMHFYEHSEYHHVSPYTQHTHCIYEGGRHSRCQVLRRPPAAGGPDPQALAGNHHAISVMT
jgi:hypothetical protein